MPTLTGAKLANITASALDHFYNTPEVYYQTIQNKPLLKLMESKKKTFSGGKELISVGVKGDFGAGGTDDQFAGFSMDDQVKFYEPENTRRAAYPWREHHIGMTITHTELKIDGLVVVDTDGEDTQPLSGREKHVLAEVLEEKVFDFGEQQARSKNKLFWGDGTTDAKALTGLKGFLTDTAATGTIGGIDRATATWWRHRTNLAVPFAVADGGAMLQFLQKELIQLRRYGATPDTALCGSDWIDALQKERRANGLYSMTGVGGSMDAEVGEIKHGGLTYKYDPTLDDMGEAKRCYVFDSSKLFLMALQRDWNRQHTPSRPFDRFVTHKSVVCTGCLVQTQANGNGVYSLA